MSPQRALRTRLQVGARECLMTPAQHALIDSDCKASAEQIHTNVFWRFSKSAPWMSLPKPQTPQSTNPWTVRACTCICDEPLVGVGVSKPVEEAAQQGIGVKVGARGGLAGLGCRGGDVLGRPDEELCNGRQSLHTFAMRGNLLIALLILVTWLQIGGH